MTHHSVMTSIIITHQKIDKFDVLSTDFSSKLTFRDVISLIINQCNARCPRCASGGHFVLASRAFIAKTSALLVLLKFQLLEELTNRFLYKIIFLPTKNLLFKIITYTRMWLKF